MMKFKKGDRVIKARVYDGDRYCFYSGDEWAVPIGTRGEIFDIPHSEKVKVKFENGICWNVHPSELELVKEPKIFIFRK